MECNVLLPATGLLNAAENYKMYFMFIIYGLFILFSALTGYVNGPVFNKEVRKNKPALLTPSQPPFEDYWFVFYFINLYLYL